MKRARRNRRDALGRRGERYAALYLRLRGYRVIARDLRTPLAQVDLLARRGSLLVLCEVKSRRGPGEITVGREQRERLRRAAHWILDRTHAPRRRPQRESPSLRIDLIEVRYSRRRFSWPRLRHYEGFIEEDDRQDWT